MPEVKSVSTPNPPATAEAGQSLLVRALVSTRGAWMTLLSFAGALLLWQISSVYLINPHLIPPPTAVWEAARKMVGTGEIIEDVAVSLSRILVGFLLGSFTAIVVGILMGRIRLLRELADPIVEVMRYLSPTAMIPIAVIWFGIGEASKYFLIFWGTFFFVLLNTIAGVLRTPIQRQRAAQCLGASELQIFLIVVLPSALPYIITGMRVAMAASFMSIIPAEMLAADSGLGYLLQQSSMLVQTDRIFVALAFICGLGFFTDRLFRVIVDKALRRFMVTGING